MNGSAQGKTESSFPLDIEELLERLAPPQTPAAAIGETPQIAKLLRGIAPLSAAALFAGLQTEPQFQANACRLEWAVRLSLGLCEGNRKATRADAYRLVNILLEKARIAILEDPIEDFFVSPVGTPRGEYLVLTGMWEKAALFTENVISAFSSLPEGEPKSMALEAAHALLNVSDEVVRRANGERYQVGSGEPNGKISLPSREKLHSLARRVKFSWKEIESLGINPNHLAAFTLARGDATSLLHGKPGDTSLEFCPLIATPDGILVAAPANIVTAVRAILINAAVQGGQGDGLQRRLLDEQARMVWDGNFIDIPNAPVRRAGTAIFRNFMVEHSKGCFVHVVQTMEGFDDFPLIAFASTPEIPAELIETIRKSVISSREFSRRQDGFFEGVTILVVGGWGRGVGFPLSDVPDEADWPLVYISPGDAVPLGRCEDGTLEDIWRLHKQWRSFEDQGFHLTHVNGLLNLFQWWRESDYGLLPEHFTDIKPPMIVNFSTDLVLKARVEGFQALDRRVLPFIDGTWKTVTRLDPRGYVGELEPTYGAVDDVRRGQLLGAVLAAPFVVWLRLTNQRGEHESRGSFETWRGAMHWLVRILPDFCAAFGINGSQPSILINLKVEWPDKHNPDQSTGEAYETLELISDGHIASVRLKPEWQWALQRPENTAEVALAVTLLQAIAAANEVLISNDELKQLIVGKIGIDARWRHSFRAARVIDELRGHGLVGRMKAIPTSAGALAKCGSVWECRPRELGVGIDGREACGAFLIEYTGHLLQKLIRQIRRFDRRSLIVAALEAFQAAQAEERQWNLTARAVRAIHGAQDDFKGSLTRQMQVNGVVRACSMLVEVAACEAPIKGGLEVGHMALSDLQAAAMMVFQNGDLASGILGDGAKPSIHFSPTGDVLSDHEFEELTLRKSAERRHEAERLRSRRAYLSRFEPTNPSGKLEDDFAAAVAAEYDADSVAVLDIAAALGDCAYDQDSGVFVMHRSELISYLEALEPMRGKPLDRLIDRLSMPIRSDWFEVPSGCTPVDFDLSKFDRRFSTIGRPLIPLGTDADPEIVVAPALVERSIAHNLGGAMNGSLQNEFWRTKAMRTYTSRAGDKSGMEFNNRLADAVREVGLRAWASAKPAWFLNIKSTREVQALGDVDVLALTKNGDYVWVIEAKDLKLCRTLGETTRRLSEYRGRTDRHGKPDKLLRHLQRVAFVRARAEELQRFFKLPSVPRVYGAIIVRAPQPMEGFPTHESPDAKVLLLDDIEQLPWHCGWSDEKPSSFT